MHARTHARTQTHKLYRLIGVKDNVASLKIFWEEKCLGFAFEGRESSRVPGVDLHVRMRCWFFSQDVVLIYMQGCGVDLSVRMWCWWEHCVTWTFPSLSLRMCHSSWDSFLISSLVWTAPVCATPISMMLWRRCCKMVVMCCYHNKYVVHLLLFLYLFLSLPLEVLYPDQKYKVF